MTRSTSSRGKGTAIAAALLLIPVIAAAAFYHERIGHWLRWGDPLPLAPDLERLLAWLPEDTQSLLVVRDAAFHSQVQDPESLGALELSHVLASAHLSSLRKGAYAAELEGRRLALSIQGSRKFRAPSGIGSMPYEGCQIIVFDGDLGAAGDRLMAQALQDSKRPLSLGKHRVAVLEERLEQDTWTFLLTRISSNTLVLATDERFLEELLRRREERPARRALPDDLPEWREIDRTAPFWALRHFDRGDAAEDPSSPFGERSSYHFRDDEAVGLAFCLTRDPAASGSRARLVYFSASQEPARILEPHWNRPADTDLKAAMRPLRKGALELVPALDDPVAVNRCFVELLRMLGHGIVI